MAAVVLATLTVGSNPAHAQAGGGLGVSVSVAFSTNVPVAAQNLPGLLTFSNDSIGSLSTVNVTIGNIRLNPSCASSNSTVGSEPCSQPEARSFPGPILSIDSGAVGRAGTGCAGILFAASSPNANGTVTLSPNSPVVLGPSATGGPASRCFVDFTFDVVQRPLDGTTVAVLLVEATAPDPNSPSTPLSGSSSSPTQITVNEAPTTIVTQASAGTVSEGSVFSDAATVTGVPGGPPLTGSVRFTLYRSSAGNPGFPTCTPAEVVTTSNSGLVQVVQDAPAPNGAPTATATFTPLPAQSSGRYAFVATYDPPGGGSPDVNYLSTTSPCADPKEQVTVAQLLPSISVQTTATPTTVNEPGGTVSFTVRVINTGARDVTLNGLNDNVYGNLDGRGTCSVAAAGSRPPSSPLLAANGGSYTCSFPGAVSGNGAQSRTDVVTAVATDVNGNTATDSDDATVTVVDVPPVVGVVTTATPASLPAPGGTFTFTVVVTNPGIEPFTVTSLNDNIYGGLATRPSSTCGAVLGSTLTAGASASCSFAGTFTGPAGSSQTDVVTVIVTDDEGNAATATDDATVGITGPGGGRYTPLTPVRIEDTRTGAGGLSGPVGPGATVDVQVAGRGGVPSGASAVAVNVTVTDPTAGGYLTLYPSGTARPLASNLNFAPGKTVPSLVVVKLGAGGRVAMFNGGGSSQVIFDVAGYFLDSGSGNAGRYESLVPARLADTRTGAGGMRLGPGQSFDVQVTGRGGAPASGVSAAVLNVAATNTSAGGYLTVYPTGEAMPLASNLNFAAGDTVSNRTMTKLGTGGRVTIYNNTGSTDVIVDLGGTYTDASAIGSLGLYSPLQPSRILDTRVGGAGAIPADGTVEVQVAGQGGVPATGARSVILTVTVTQPVGSGYLTIFPSGAGRPVASDLNDASGETRANLVVVQVGAGGRVSLYTSTQTDVVVDVAGWFS